MRRWKKADIRRRRHTVGVRTYISVAAARRSGLLRAYASQTMLVAAGGGGGGQSETSPGRFLSRSLFPATPLTARRDSRTFLHSALSDCSRPGESRALSRNSSTSRPLTPLATLRPYGSLRHTLPIISVKAAKLHFLMIFFHYRCYYYSSFIVIMIIVILFAS